VGTVEDTVVMTDSADIVSPAMTPEDRESRELMLAELLTT
jgi:hypothetical protein